MNERIDLPCLCANVRRASRVLSQIYDDAMRPLGLRMTQFSILQALSLTGPRLQGELAEFLALDSTSFTRAAQQLRRRGWVKTVKGKDRRERLVSLSQSGEAELARAKPARETVQENVGALLGEERRLRLIQLSTAVANLPATPAQKRNDESSR
jgi:DNA-binding MarR family transcriptional regulator